MKKNDPVILAFFTAFAITIYIVENLIPKPLPFLKLGLANVIVLLLLWKGNYLAAMIVLISKSILGGLFSGLLLSPMTVISLGASFTAFILMGLALRSKLGFSILGVSIIGATAHNIMQLVIVNWLLVHSTAVWKLLPLMILLGLVTGLITGYLAYLLSRQPTIKKYLAN
ncbi:MAG: Gx transporter family protein [Candidatus Cloacimonetes bacterium]|nr:Gx transporter family protein [Candidatus Cloacimonadota bacterium]